ncbi:hypothetical protein JCM11491_006871 [Sporobolomyces phaffii]
MQFLARFKSSKDASSKNHRRHSTPPSTTQSSSSYLPLSLPSSSFLRDESLAIPLGATSEDPLDATLSSSRSVDTTPWIEVAHDAVGGPGASPRIVHRRPLEGDDPGHKVDDPLKARKEMAKLEKGRIELEQMVTLVEECGQVIRSRGLTTLGLFRPFRLPESLPLIRQLCLLYLDYVSEFDPAHDSTTMRGTRASKTVKLHRFTEELRYAEIHSVVAVLKWGFRHFAPSTPPFSPSPARAPFDFYYDSYLVSTSNASYPRSAFSQFLLPSLAPPSRALLVATLDLIQAVSAYSELNAMTCRKLCLAIGYYLFRFDDDTARSDAGAGAAARGPEWQRLHARWLASGQVLEGLVKGYLWGQDGLPPRLRELVDDYPTFVERSRTGEGDGGVHAGRNVRAIVVDLESRGRGWKRVGDDEEGKANDQATGYLVTGTEEEPFARRKPVEILADALEARPGEEGDATAAWTVIREAGGVREILDEEVVRVFDLLGLSSSSSSSSDPLYSTATRGAADLSPSPRRRVTSGPLSSLSEESHSNAFGNFPNKSVTHLSPARDQKRTVTPSWNDFARTGFSNSPASVIDISDEFGRFNAPAGPEPVSTATATNHAMNREPSRITKVEVVAAVEEEFADLWLDSVFESTTTASPLSRWPSFVIAPLHASLSAPLANLEASRAERIYLVVSDTLLPLEGPTPAPRPPPVLQRNSSRTSGKAEASSLDPRKWTKRASSIFGGGGGGSGGGGGRTRSTTAETSPTIALTKSKKTSRKSMFFSESVPPPVPIPSRTSVDRPPSPQPYSTSPPSLEGEGGNVVTRTLSRTVHRRKSKSSLGGGGSTSPARSDERDVRLSSSPSKFEAELWTEPVPAIPAKYSATLSASETSPVAAAAQPLPIPVPVPVPAPELDRAHRSPNPDEIETAPLALLPSSDLPETPLREILLRGPPILGAAIAPVPSPPGEDPIATAIRTPSSEDAASLVLDAGAANPLVAAGSAPSPRHPATELVTTTTPEPATVTALPQGMASPTFTLSPPGGEPEVLAEASSSRETDPEDPGALLMHDAAPPPPAAASTLGLGLSNVDRPVFVEPDAGEPAATSRVENLGVGAALGATNPDSPTIPTSPTPSQGSAASSSTTKSSKRFLARTRSFLSRKKSSSQLVLAADANSDPPAKTRDPSSSLSNQRPQTPPRRPWTAKVPRSAAADKERVAVVSPTPTPVSSVKKRVAELEAASLASSSSEIINGGGGGNSHHLPSSPTTSAARIVVPPRPRPNSPTPPASPSPGPQDPPGSAASSIVPLPRVDHDEAVESSSLVREVVEEEIRDEQLETELGPTDSGDDHRGAEALGSPSEDVSTLAPPDPAEADESKHEEHVSTTARLTDEASTAAPGAPEEEHAADADERVEVDGIGPSSTRAVPTQEEQHLDVKVPTRLEDLPSPLPSPSPAPVDEGHASAAPLVGDDHDESIPTVLAEEDDTSRSHVREPTDSTIEAEVEADAASGDGTGGGGVPMAPRTEPASVPHTPIKQVVAAAAATAPSEEDAALATPVAPSATLFPSSSPPSSSPAAASRPSPAPLPLGSDNDPFVAVTTETTNPGESAPPSRTGDDMDDDDETRRSESRPSLASTRNSMDTFETAAVVPTSTAPSLVDVAADADDDAHRVNGHDSSPPPPP